MFGRARAHNPVDHGPIGHGNHAGNGGIRATINISGNEPDVHKPDVPGGQMPGGYFCIPFWWWYVPYKTFSILAVLIAVTVMCVGGSRDIRFGEMCDHIPKEGFTKWSRGYNVSEMCYEIVPDIIQIFPGVEFLSVKNMLYLLGDVLPEKTRDSNPIRLLPHMYTDAEPGSPLSSTLTAFSKCVQNGRVDLICVRDHPELFKKPEPEKIFVTVEKEVIVTVFKTLPDGVKFLVEVTPVAGIYWILQRLYAASSPKDVVKKTSLAVQIVVFAFEHPIFASVTGTGVYTVFYWITGGVSNVVQDVLEVLFGSLY